MARLPLFLHEDLLLLMLKDQEGTFYCGSWNQLAVGAGLLGELLLAGFVELERDRRKTFVVASGTSTPGDPLMAEALSLIRNMSNRRQADYWVLKFAAIRQLLSRVAEGLIARKVLRSDSMKILLIFDRTIYPEIDPGPEKELIGRMESAIEGIGEVTDRTMAAVVIADLTDILSARFPRTLLRLHGKRIKEFGAGNPALQGIKDAIQRARDTMVIQMVVPVIVTG